jgi:hypothetical protein
LPIAHAWHDVDPLLGAIVPAAQASQASRLLAPPTAVPIVPGAQPLHEIFFSLFW